MAGVKTAPTGGTITDLFRTASIELAGTTYTFRELSVKENNQCVQGSKQADGSFDGRIMMKLMVLKSAIEPKLTDTELDDFPNRLYLRLCDVVSDLNADDESTEDEDPKNA